MHSLLGSIWWVTINTEAETPTFTTTTTSGKTGTKKVKKGPTGSSVIRTWLDNPTNETIFIIFE